MTAPRHYPTDLLLAVGQVERLLAEQPDCEIAALLGSAGVAQLWSAHELTAGLDDLFAGLSQYPWQPLIDTDEVVEFTPVGTVVFDDRRTGNTLRGLLLGWAVGDDVVIRTEQRDFWTSLISCLRALGFPLPAGTVVARDEDVPGGTPVSVPDVVAAGATWSAGPIFGLSADTGDPQVTIRIGPGADPDPAALARRVLRLDCAAAWTGRLYRRELLQGSRLALARSTDGEQEDARIAAKLRYLVECARRTPYYRELPRITHRDDLGRLPILDKAALEKHSLPSSADLSSGAAPSGEVLRSGATTGAPRYIVYSRTDWNNMMREAIPMFYELGLRPGDRIINALFGGNLYGGLITSSMELARMPVEAYSAGQTVTVDDVLQLARGFSANAVLGQPALLMPLLRRAKEAEPALRIEKVFYGGSPMAESDKRWLREQLGTRVITSALAANDGAQLGYQCPYMSGTLHHLCDDYNLIEVVDDGGRPLPDGDVGELLITSLQKFEGPLIRYQIGDVGRISRLACECGVTGRVLDYLGRSDGQIKVKGRTVTHGEILAELGAFGVSQLQLEIVSRDFKEIVLVRTESPEQLDPRELREHLAARFEVLSDRHAFDTALDVFEFEVECHAEGHLPRHPVSGKIRPVIDRRLDPAGPGDRMTALYHEHRARPGSALTEIDPNDAGRFPHLAELGLTLAPHPLFLGRREVERFGDDVVRIVDLLVTLPERLFDNDLERVRAALGIDPAKARLIRSLGGGKPLSMGRVDAHHDGSSLKILEFNATSEAGGQEWVGAAAASLLAFESFRTFADGHGLSRIDTNAMLASGLRAAGAAVTGGGDPVVALVEGPGGLAEFGHAWRPLQRIIREHGLDCHLGETTDLSVRNGRVLMSGAPVDVVYRVFELSQVLADPQALAVTEQLRDAAEAGTVVLWTPLETEIHRNKLWMAYLSDPRLGAGLSAQEQRLVDRVLPWTRALPREGEGPDRELWDRCVSNREELILKPNDGYGGRGITCGWLVDDQSWSQALRQAGETGAVVQERVVPRQEWAVDPATGRLENWEACWSLFWMPGGFAGGGARLVPTGQTANPETRRKAALYLYPDDRPDDGPAGDAA